MHIIANRHALLKAALATDKESNKRRSAEVVAENVYFGDSKKNDNAGGQEPPAGFVPNFHNGGSLPY